jgi:hypothetical protein
MKNANLRIAIIGGGIAGLTTAVALRKLGFRPTIFESAPEIKALGAGLALAANAIKALERIGIADKIIPAGQLLDRFSILDQAGMPITVADNRMLSARYGVNNFAIHRSVNCTGFCCKRRAIWTFLPAKKPREYNKTRLVSRFCFRMGPNLGPMWCWYPTGFIPVSAGS